MTPELRALYERMTRLQKGVVLELIEGAKYEAAYKEAGGLAKTPETARVIVSKMLTNANVKAFMEAAEEEAVDSSIMTKKEALKGLSNIANGNVSDLVNFSTVTLQDADGKEHKQTVWALKDNRELTRDEMALISELAATKDGFKFKTHSPLQAKKQLSDMLGWNAPQKVAQTDTEGEDLDPIAQGRAILFALNACLDSKDGNQDTLNDNTIEGEHNANSTR